MKRVHLIEIHEQSWCPSVVRDGMTDFLQMSIRLLGIFDYIVPHLADAMRRTGERRIVDLCTGGSGPWTRLHGRLERALGHEADVRMTDLYPSSSGVERVAALRNPRLCYETRSVDATDVPQDMVGFRTIFDAFHQFPPEVARAVMADAAKSKQGLAVFELCDRHPWTMFSVVALPLALLVLVPFMRPFRWSRLVVTYLIPVLPLVLLFDAFVSCVRTYRPSDLDQLIASLDPVEDYEWSRGQVRVPWRAMRVTYLIGTPRTDASAP